MTQAQEVDEKPPAQVQEDWNFFLNHVNNNNEFEIKPYFEKNDWKIDTIHRMRISHIYDPSHFWVVSKESELDALLKYFYDFYSQSKDFYKMPSKYFKINMYCVTYTEGNFYRSILVNIPLTIEKEIWAFAFLIDFGYMAKVSVEEIYFMPKKLYSVPRFAIRATLSGLGPMVSTKWPSNAIARFHELANNKILICQVTNVDCANKILFLRLANYNFDTKNLDCINEALVIEKLARQMTITDVRVMRIEDKKKGKLSRKVRLPFLLPSFDEIENGICVDTAEVVRDLNSFFVCK